MPTTYDKKNPETIQALFGSIAQQYDRTNAILSFQLHRYWNACLVQAVSHASTLLDLCAGTGAIGLRFLRKTRGTHATLLDFCPEMLAYATHHASGIDPARIDYVTGDAMQLPFSDTSFDAITIAYGIRNVKEPMRCFAEAYRVLRPEGTLAILELTRPTFSPLRWSHGLYLKYALPLLGKLATSNQQAYEYLCNSIEDFVEPTLLQKQLEEARFETVRLIPLTGGIATLIIAQKGV